MYENEPVCFQILDSDPVTAPEEGRCKRTLSVSFFDSYKPSRALRLGGSVSVSIFVFKETFLDTLKADFKRLLNIRDIRAKKLCSSDL